MLRQPPPQVTPLNHMRITQSLQGIAVPIVFGTTRVPGKLIWYGDFKSQVQTNPGGKSKGSKNAQLYTYSASFIALICEGPVLGFLSFWDHSGQFLTNPAVVNYQIPIEPANPALAYTAGGTLPATTYYVTITYVDAGAESAASAEASLAVPADNLLVVQTPSTIAPYTGWNVYVATSSGAETKQNTAAQPIGDNWTMPASGLVSGGAAHPTQPIVSPPPPQGHTTWPGPINVDTGVNVGGAIGRRVFFN